MVYAPNCLLLSRAYIISANCRRASSWPGAVIGTGSNVAGIVAGICGAFPPAPIGVDFLSAKPPTPVEMASPTLWHCTCLGLRR
jgi:hypothetical protein